MISDSWIDTNFIHYFAVIEKQYTNGVKDRIKKHTQTDTQNVARARKKKKKWNELKMWEESNESIITIILDRTKLFDAKRKGKKRPKWIGRVKVFRSHRIYCRFLSNFDWISRVTQTIAVFIIIIHLKIIGHRSSVLQPTTHYRIGHIENDNSPMKAVT